MRPLVEDVEGNFEGSTIQKIHIVKDRMPKSATAQQSINQYPFVGIYLFSRMFLPAGICLKRRLPPLHKRHL
jgi:hypothetical protein